ncbi:uncharacterized protein LOC105662690 [Megachile rotundata]|uniref:uncharacterized protein LOC105662690 n=1 Tax=Megachile rotundata TaxID=143995 RepID=UPI003FD484D3
MDHNRKACESDKDEKLYILEIFIDSVNMYSEKLDKIDAASLGVDLNIIDIPVFRIFQSSFLLTKPDRGKEKSYETGFCKIAFNCGKMYMFTRNPSVLIQKLREKPILLDVYKIKEILICPEEVIKHPLGHTTIPLSGCLCDHTTMASNDIYHLPKSYEIKNMFGLIDEEDQPAGFIKVFIRLTCFGTYTTTPFAIAEKKLLFKNIGSFNEFLCTKVPYSDEDDRRAAEASAKFCMPDKIFEESELDTPPRTINTVGLILVCKELSLRDGFPADVVHPNYPPKLPDVSIEERSFDVEKARRKGFKQAVFEEPATLVESEFVSTHRECINIGCAGSICSGKK